MLVDTPL